MADFSGGFAGDRAGIMNLENVLSGVTQNAMANRMFQAQMGQQEFERQMAQQQFGLAQKQFGLQKQLAPYQTIAPLLPWMSTDPTQREQMIKELYSQIMGGKMGSSDGLKFPQIFNSEAPSIPGNPDDANKLGGLKSILPFAINPMLGFMNPAFAQSNPNMSRMGLDMGGSIAGSALGSLGGPAGSFAGGLAGGAGADSLWNQMYGNSPSSMGQAIFSNNPSNVAKRQSRASGVAAPKNSTPSPK